MNDMEFINLLNELNINLTEEQQKVATSIDGCYSVVAVPGAGKSTTLTCRTAYMILVKGVSPKRIMTVTYSKASALDMKDKFMRKFGPYIPDDVYFATIHSFAYSVLRNYSYLTNTKYTFIEGNTSGVTKTSILRNLYKKYNKEPINDDKLEELNGFIGFLINRMVGMKDLEKYKASYPVPQFTNIYIDYLDTVEQNKFLDFDLMLKLCYDILVSDKSMLNYYSNMYDYYQCDEAQDTSLLQFSILKLLSKTRTSNLCIFSDDDQAIYSWRGGDPNLIINFKEFYSQSAVTLFMSRNFRSTKKIVRLANEFIKSNEKRIAKELYTENMTGEDVIFLSANDEFDQVEYIIDQIKNKPINEDFAVLFRNNLSSIPLVDRLIKENIQFYIKDAVPSFFNSWITKDFLNFFNFAFNPSNCAAFEYIYYKIKTYIKKEDIKALSSLGDKLEARGISVFDYLSSNSELTQNQKERLNSFSVKFTILSKLKPLKAIEYIESELNYKEYLKEYARKYNYSIDSIENMISTLKILAEGLDSVDSFIDKIEFLQQEMLNSRKNRGKSSIVLSTLHSSKGLEFDNVIIMDMTSNFPSLESIEKKKEGDSSMYEEELRLAYVGVTRSKKILYLIHPLKRNGVKIGASPFFTALSKLESLDKRKNSSIKSYFSSTVYSQNASDTYKLNLRDGDTINHKKWGLGSVVKLNGDIITIMFNNGQIKNLSLKACAVGRIIELV